MLIEATKPLRVRLPQGELNLEPGKPVEMADEQARRLLVKARGKVRVVPSWLTAWRGIADLVHGVTLDDPRVPAIMTAIELCDVAFAADDWSAFQQATEVVRQAVAGPNHER